MPIDTCNSSNGKICRNPWETVDLGSGPRGAVSSIIIKGPCCKSCKRLPLQKHRTHVDGSIKEPTRVPILTLAAAGAMLSVVALQPCSALASHNSIFSLPSPPAATHTRSGSPVIPLLNMSQNALVEFERRSTRWIVCLLRWMISCRWMPCVTSACVTRAPTTPQPAATNSR